METYVSIRALRASLHFADHKDIRAICKTVMIDGGALVTTNGCSLFAHRIEDSDASFMVPMDAVQTLLSAVGKRAEGAVTVEADALVYGSCRVAYVANPCRMPEWRLRVPRAVTGEAAAYDPKYLTAAMKARDNLTGSKSALPCQIGMTGTTTAGVINLPMDSLAIIMPYRNEPAGAPEWVHA